MPGWGVRRGVGRILERVRRSRHGWFVRKLLLQYACFSVVVCLIGRLIGFVIFSVLWRRLDDRLAREERLDTTLQAVARCDRAGGTETDLRRNLIATNTFSL